MLKYFTKTSHKNELLLSLFCSCLSLTPQAMAQNSLSDNYKEHLGNIASTLLSNSLDENPESSQLHITAPKSPNAPTIQKLPPLVLNQTSVQNSSSANNKEISLAPANTTQTQKAQEQTLEEKVLLLTDSIAPAEHPNLQPSDYLYDEGKEVLLELDSITPFKMPSVDILAISDGYTNLMDRMAGSPAIRKPKPSPALRIEKILNRSPYPGNFLNNLNTVIYEYALINNQLTVLDGKSKEDHEFIVRPSFQIKEEENAESVFFLILELFDQANNLKGYWSKQIKPSKPLPKNNK